MLELHIVFEAHNVDNESNLTMEGDIGWPD